MKKTIILCFLVGSGLFFACQRKHVCPAYQSAFIIDEKITNSFFSQFEDSIPKRSLFVNKNKRGIMVKMRYQQKQKDIYTVKMKMTYPPLADSLILAGMDLSAMNEAEIDSIMALSPIRRASYNRDQEIYMMYIGQFNVAKAPEVEQIAPIEDPVSIQEEPKKKKWFWNRNKKQKEVQEVDENEDEDDLLQEEF